MPHDPEKYLYDVVSIWDQGRSDTPATNLAHVCCAEGRALITLDLDFADIRAYPPEEYQGLIVLGVVQETRR